MIGKILKQYIFAIGLAVVAALAVRFFLLEAYKVPTDIMKPNLVRGDYIFALKWPFGIRLPGSNRKITEGRKPRFGEVVLFQSEEDGRIFVRRVMGLPGEEITLKQGLILRGKEEPQFQLKKGLCGTSKHSEQTFEICLGKDSEKTKAEKIKLPEKTYLVAADNRLASDDPSDDQKIFMQIEHQHLLAKPSLIWLSIEPNERSGWFPAFRFGRMLLEL